MDGKKIGIFIATLRKEKSMTQKELACQLNITDKAVSKWENGDGYPEITLIPALAEILGVTIDELFNGERIATQIPCTADKEQQKNAQAAYLLNANLLKFKSLSLLSMALTLLGFISFFTITLTTYYEVLGFGVQMTMILASCVLFKIASDNRQNAAKTYGEIYPGSSDHWQTVAYANKIFITSIWLWVCSICATVPYVIFDDSVYLKSIITLETYFSLLPVFLTTGVAVSWLVTIFLRFNASNYPKGSGHEHKFSVNLLGLVIDAILVLLIMLSALVIESEFMIPVLLIVYISFPVLYVIKNKARLSKAMTIAFPARNAVIAIAVLFGQARSFMFYYAGPHSPQWGNRLLYIDWSRLNTSLGYILILIILLTLLLKHLGKESIN